MISDWILAFAALVQTIAIVVLVYVTRKYAKSTEEIAEASRESTKKSEQMIREIKRDRVYRLRPIVIPVAGFQHVKNSVGVHEMKFTLANIGSGPVLNLEAECILGNIRMKGCLAGIASCNTREIALSGAEKVKEAEKPMLTLIYNNVASHNFKTVSEIIENQFVIKELELGDEPEIIKGPKPEKVRLKFDQTLDSANKS